MLRILIIASLALAPTFAAAQDQPAPDAPSVRCLIAGKSFSPGATIRASSGVTLCDPGGAWVASDKPASGCFLGDNFYSVGSIAGASSSKAMVETCNADGTWSAATGG
jgi:hypothetical protein